MVNHIQFPTLGLDVTIKNIAFTVFGIDIYWYGIIATVALLSSVIVGLKLGEKYYGINQDKFIDVIMIGGIFGIICARIYYVMFAPFEYASFWDMINIRDGGIGIYGGIIGGLVFGGLACKWRKIDFLNAADISAICFLLGQSIGRWGNFVNQEAFGTNTTSIFGMISEETTNYLLGMQDWLLQFGVQVDPYAPVHPTFLYESVWCIVGFFLLLAFLKHRKFKGQMLSLYAIWYGVGRFFIEGLRTDSLATTSGLRTSQIIALISIALAVVANIVMLKKAKETVKNKEVDIIEEETQETQIEETQTEETQIAQEVIEDKEEEDAGKIN